MKLRDYLQSQDIAVASFADTIGVTQTALYRYLSEERLPRREIIAKIETETAGAVRAQDFYSQSSSAA